MTTMLTELPQGDRGSVLAWRRPLGRYPMDLLNDFPIEYRPWRPPTAVYPDRGQVAYFRERDFPATAGSLPRIFCLNLEDGLFAAGALKDLILPIAQGIRGGAYGQAILVVASSDDGVIDYLEGLAERHDLTLFLLPHMSSPLSQARPVGSLTPAEAQALELMKQAGGQATSSTLAQLAGVEVNAAVNRLRGVSDKGYVCRVATPKRQGDVFFDPLALVDRRLSTLIASHPDADHQASIPSGLYEEVKSFAGTEGRSPGELLIQAWREFAARHKMELDADSERVRKMLSDDDETGLAAYVNKSVKDRAQEASRKAREP